MTTESRLEPRSQRENDLLKYGRKKGREEERKQIIERLENELGAGIDIQDTQARDSIIQYIIKLIKGEQE